MSPMLVPKPNENPKPLYRRQLGDYISLGLKSVFFATKCCQPRDVSASSHPTRERPGPCRSTLRSGIQASGREAVRVRSQQPQPLLLKLGILRPWRWPLLLRHLCRLQTQGHHR